MPPKEKKIYRSLYFQQPGATSIAYASHTPVSSRKLRTLKLNFTIEFRISEAQFRNIKWLKEDEAKVVPYVELKILKMTILDQQMDSEEILNSLSASLLSTLGATSIAS